MSKKVKKKSAKRKVKKKAAKKVRKKSAKRKVKKKATKRRLKKKTAKRKAKKRTARKVKKKARKKKPSRRAVKAAKIREIDAELKKLGDELTPRHKAFAECYVRDPDCFGNGVQAYAKVYRINLLEHGAYETCVAAASRLLRFVKVCEYIAKLLDVVSLNTGNADRNLAFLMNQFDDFSTKLGAIKEFNKLKGRITDKFKGTQDIRYQPVMFGTPQKKE